MHLPAAATVPTSAPARIEALDALRGLALCGILFVNLPAITGMNPTAGPWLELLAHQRFFPLFSFLFGLGTALFLDGAGPTTRDGSCCAGRPSSASSEPGTSRCNPVRHCCPTPSSAPSCCSRRPGCRARSSHWAVH